ncbi:unnamed protein product [Cylindrotheca closterium]|uniref:Uncharacterized protein n=1 Tax=Cylindrotheca closterium TaxID=2856 RepID=A0AAD2GB03_9STRA|nr:unnamed protein product [Cylindrotheca closterium]
MAVMISFMNHSMNLSNISWLAFLWIILAVVSLPASAATSLVDSTTTSIVNSITSSLIASYLGGNRSSTGIDINTGRRILKAAVVQIPRGGGEGRRGGNNQVNKKQKGKKGANNDVVAHSKDLGTFVRMGVEATLGILFIFLSEASSSEQHQPFKNKMVVSGGVCMALLLVEIARFLGEDAAKLSLAALAMVTVLFLLQP